jgi:hypothetical protein
VSFAWERTGTGDRNVKTSVLTTGGSLATQRVVYGTADGVVHFRRLTDGTPMGGKDGFQHTTGAVSGDLVIITDDSGRQRVVRLSDGKPVTNTAQFQRRPADVGADDGGLGQPAVARGYVQFGGPDGVFVYRTTPPAPASPAPAEDAPPSVSFTSPADSARLSGTPTLTADAADDRGVASVRFMAGARLLCTDTTAPYACAFPLTGTDVGRATLIAVATDGAGQTASAVRGVRVRRFTPSSSASSCRPRARRSRAAACRSPARARSARARASRATGG